MILRACLLGSSLLLAAVALLFAGAGLSEWSRASWGDRIIAGLMIAGFCQALIGLALGLGWAAIFGDP